jgi:hypothetical protein
MLNVIRINFPCSKQISLVIMHRSDLFSGGTHFESCQGHKLSCVLYFSWFSVVFPVCIQGTNQVPPKCNLDVTTELTFFGAAMYHIMEGAEKFTLNKLMLIHLGMFAMKGCKNVPLSFAICLCIHLSTINNSRIPEQIFMKFDNRVFY